MSENIIFQEETAHLLATRCIIEREIDRLQAETGLHDETVNDVPVQVKGIDDETIAMQIFLSRVAVLKSLWRARHQAYFAHLKFCPEGGSTDHYYIGRWGVYDPEKLHQEVVDWRAPLANLYYSGDVGEVHYCAPDGEIHGNLLLKRILSIRDDKVLHAYETGIVGQESWLDQVLEKSADARLHEIVTSIQREQNLIIRAPIKEHLIVQGVAGSGKTSIALHRIAYLLYKHREEMRPENILILAPSPLFLSYISQVLPELGVEHVRQCTFQDLASSWFGKALPRICFSSADDCPAPEVMRRHRIKSSLEYKMMLEGFLKREEVKMLPSEDICFSRYLLVGKQELEELFLQKLTSWPLAQRILEVQKIVKRRLEKLTDKMKQTMESMAQQKLERMMAELPDGEERRRRAGKLLDSRNARIQEIDDHARAFLRNFPKMFSDTSLSSVYMRFLMECSLPEVQKSTLELLKRGMMEEADLPALMLIGRAVLGVPHEKVRHIVIDESQDMSAFALQILCSCFPGATLTLVGDLMQGIHADTGTMDYEEWIQPVFGGKIQYRTLQVSYRSTFEINELARKVAGHANHKMPEMYSVQRHGENPELKCYSCEEERIQMIRETEQRWREQNMNSIAIIANSREEASHILKAANFSSAALLDEKTTDYVGGTVLMTAGECKGMEFDAVIICNASQERYPEDEWHAHMMYVLVTRPLHKLMILAKEKLSPLLVEKEK